MNYNLLFLKVNPKNFLDIGAHEGEFAWEVRKRYPECKIISIEANPYCEKYLQKIGVEYQIIGLSSDKTNKKLFFEKKNPASFGASFYKENTEFYDDGLFDTIEVESDTLDNRDFFSGQVIDFVKIDTQGSEFDILSGGKKTIKRSKYVLIECSTVQYNQGSKLIDEIVKKMKEYEFSVDDIFNFNKINNTIMQMDVLFKNLYL